MPPSPHPSRPIRTGFSTTEPPRAGAGALLAVLGDPIAHSKSPELHHAAYAELGLPWDYARWQIPRHALAESLGARHEGWRGVSVTAPLKAEALAAATTASDDARRSGAANTLVFETLDPAAPAHAENTDIPGIVRAFNERGVRVRPGVAQVLGAGETAASVALAALRLGAERVCLFARRPEQAEALARRLGAGCSGHDLVDWQLSGDTALLVDTIPGGYAAVPEHLRAQPLGDTPLLSAAYHPWPTPLAEAWLAASAPIITGEDMLLHQALLQVRLFTGGDLSTPLRNEPAVLERMRAALV